MKSLHEYIFILGRYPDLSKQELLSVLRTLSQQIEIKVQSDTFVIIQSKNELSIELLNKKLGGTVKIGKILHTFDSTVGNRAILDYLSSDALFIDIFPNPKDKIIFGISYYSDQKNDSRSQKVFADILRPLKAHLEDQGFSVRFPRHEGAVLSSASVGKNKLLTNGAEILIVRTETNVFLGKTIAIQEFEEFSKRDYGRPARDMESGIIPPKIARMMLNLAEVDQTATIIDPFCGSGTIIQEAMLLGYNNITGSDLSQKAIKDTKKNIDWLKKEQQIQIEPDIRYCDVTKLSETFGEKKFDAIIAEPYMGPNHQQTPKVDQIQTIIKELEQLYLAAWTEYAKVLTQEGVVVMILPVFHIHNQYFTMNILNAIEKLGFIQVPLQETKRRTLLIGNKYDFVLREIVKYKKEVTHAES